jgi:iron(III) transport system permease protein
MLEQISRNRRNFATSARGGGGAQRIRLRAGNALLATLAAGLVFLLAFLIPMLQLLVWTREIISIDLDWRYIDFAWHSLLLASMGATLVVCLALALGYAQRLHPTPAMQFTTRLANIGYALPGAVLAVGFYIPVAGLDNLLIDTWRDYSGQEIGQIFGGTIAVMLLAYCARFLAVGFGPVETGLARITRSMDEAAQVLGKTGMKRLLHVHLPMLRAPLLAAAALAFVDIMKELPITLMTRPFGWDTLATRVFEMTSEGEWERAALPAVAICLVGLLPIYLLVKHSDART